MSNQNAPMMKIIKHKVANLQTLVSRLDFAAHEPVSHLLFAVLCWSDARESAHVFLARHDLAPERLDPLEFVLCKFRHECLNVEHRFQASDDRLFHLSLLYHLNAL